MVFSDEFVDSVNGRLWGEAVGLFGSKFDVPVVWSDGISEYVRGLFVLQVFFGRKGGLMSGAVVELRSFGVSDVTVERFFVDGVLCRDEVVLSGGRVLSRRARLELFEVWARGCRGEEFSVDVLLERSGFSRVALLDYLRFSRLFLKVRRGVFRVVVK